MDAREHSFSSHIGEGGFKILLSQFYRKGAGKLCHILIVGSAVLIVVHESIAFLIFPFC